MVRGILMAALLAAAGASHDKTAASSPPSHAASKAERPARGELHKVAIKGMKFVPAKVTLKAGDTVEWTNEDIVPHTATGQGFDSGPLDPRKSFKHTFKEATSGKYVCRLHPGMEGELEVK